MGATNRVCRSGGPLVLVSAVPYPVLGLPVRQQHNEWSTAEPFTGQDATSAAHRAKDWATTPLGPVESWPFELRAAVRTVMPSRVPMLLWWGPDLVQVFNHAYTPVLGDKYPAAVGQPARECWAEVWDELKPLADQVLAGGEATYARNLRLDLRRHGYLEETYWTFSYSPVHAEDGSVAAVFVATTDVTARVLGERRRETLRRLGMLSITEVDTPADVCRAAVAVLADSRADLPVVRAHLRTESGGLELVAGTEDTEVADETLVRQVAATGRTQHVTGAVVAPLVTGSAVVGVLVLGVSRYRELDDAYATFLDLVAAKVASVVGDVTAYGAERARAEALTELDTAKTRFFQNVSHEFRTPLTLLLGPLSVLLEDTALTSRQRDALAAAHRAALRLGKLVDALLDVARAEAGELHGNAELTDVAAVTVECASMFRSAAERAGLALVVEVEKVVAVVDHEMWARIVLNLVSNAIKFTRKGSVTVTLSAGEYSLTLSVADTGVGIPTGDQGRIFERFHRVENIAGRGSEGAGIGLALVSDLATALGGGVAVSSRPGAGSTFTVTVPRVPADHTPVTAGPSRLAEIGGAFVGETRQWEPPSPAASGDPGFDRHILLVEDNADMRDYLVRLLTDQHWSVDAVADAETALARARLHRPDLVLSDVMLPGRDGMTLLRELRADPSLARLPVVLLTARAGAESAVEGLRDGADDYIVKPFHPTELIARVRVHLELSHFRESLITRGEHEAEGLRAAVSSRGTIGQAVGILMALHMCDPDAAFNRLVAMSQRDNVKLRDVASDLVRKFVANIPA
jgi:signal transduction histidine kinase/CheY-like chemotaxis protein